MKEENPELQVNELRKICFEKPFKVSKPEDFDYIELAKKYPFEFIIDGYVIYSINMLKRFIINDIKLQLTKRNNISIIEVLDNLEMSFLNSFNEPFPHILIENIKDGWIDIQMSQYSYIPDSEFYPIELFLISYIKDKSFYWEKNPADHNIYYVRKKTFQKTLLKNAIIDILKENQSLKLSLLVHKLNSSSLDFEIEKPISEQKIKEILLNDNFTFSLKTDNFSDDPIIEFNETGYFSSLIKENLIDIHSVYQKGKPQKAEKSVVGELFAIAYNNTFAKPRSGVFSAIYTGEQFPLIEAEEYVKVRNIIYISATEDLSKTISNILEYDRFNEEEFLINLYSILSSTLISLDIKENQKQENYVYINKDDQDYSKKPESIYKDWIKNNIKFSFIAMPSQEAITFVKRFINAYSPVLNIENNLGNLFTTLILEKKKEFLRKLEI